MSIHQDKPEKKKQSSSNRGLDDGEDDGEDSDSDLHHIFSESLGGDREKYIPFSGVDIDTNCVPVTGAWAALADAESIRSNVHLSNGPSGSGKIKGLIGSLPAKFNGLAMPEKNPMSMQMSHEEVVVGCADGTI
jgi:pyrimidine and pyridine-specific 5'-nucleotidase